MDEKTEKKVMLSGIQPSGDLTLGSYLGAIKNWAERAEAFALLLLYGGYAHAELCGRTLPTCAGAPWNSWPSTLPRPGPGEKYPLHPEPCAPACPAELGAELLHHVWGAVPDDPVQGQECPER